MLRRLPRRSFPLAAVLGAALAACSGGNPAGPGSQGTLTLTVTTSVSLNIGGTASANLSIVRGGGFVGVVSISVSGLPNGVTAAFVPATLDANTTAGVLNLTAALTATAGITTLTITAGGTGVTTQTATVQLTVVQPTIALALTPAALSVTAGQNGTVTVAITRSAGFTGSVTLVLDAPPAGVTGSFVASPTTAANSTLTLMVAGTVVAGQYPVNIKGTAAGALDKTVALTLTVVAAGPTGFNVTVDPAEFELPAGKGWSANGIVSIQRTNGFAGPVTVTVQGLGFPAAVVATPATIAANATATNLLSLVVDNGAPGLYTGTVKVSAPGFGDQTMPVKVRVSLPSTGSITWNFCRADRVPKYFAVQDGNGAWKHIVPDGPAGATQATPAKFSFDLTQSTASIALVWLGEKTSATPLIEGHYWNVFYLTRPEILDLAAEECISNRDVTTRVATGPVTGYQSFDAIVASVGRHGLAFVGSTGPLNTTLTMQNLDTGPFDLLLTRSNFNSGPGPDITVQSLVLRRGIDPAAGGTTSAIDFGTEGVAPASAALTFTNTAGETFANAMTFRTTDGLNGWMAASGFFAATTRVWFGIPSNQLVAGDLHQITATTLNVAARRQIIYFSHDVVAKTLAFGPALSSPTVTPVLATPWILRAAGTVGPDYVSRVSVYYRENVADPRTMTIVASRGFLGGTTQYDVPVPDLAGIPGFTAFWNLRRSSPVKWVVTGGQGSTGDLLVDLFCTATGFCPVKAVDGTTYLSAQSTGTLTIP